MFVLCYDLLKLTCIRMKLYWNVLSDYLISCAEGAADSLLKDRDKFGVTTHTDTIVYPRHLEED